MRAVLGIIFAVVVLGAPIVIAQEGVLARVERRGVERSLRHAGPGLALRARADARRVSIVADRWREGCSGHDRLPAFRVHVSGRAIVLEREGRSPAPRCEAVSSAFCSTPDGDMIDCPPRPCVCVYRITAEVTVDAPGDYEVSIADGEARRAVRALRIP